MSLSQENTLSAQRPAGFFARQASGTKNVGEMERWLSMAAGGALLVTPLARGRLPGLLSLGVAAGLIYRGLSGHCHLYQALGVDTSEDQDDQVGVPARQGVKVEQTMVIHRPASELFHFWQDLDQLPEVFQHLKKVHSNGQNRSHWVARGPFEMDIQWDAEIINRRENELLAWRSLPGGDIDTAGSVHFRSTGTPGQTEVTVSMKYNPPGGQIGAVLASWFGSGLEQLLAEDLERFQQKMQAQHAQHR